MTGMIDMAQYRHCELCPWKCRVDRTAGELGRCQAPAQLKVADYMPHFGEEACLVGDGGSGAVFFSFCTLGCLFCQTFEISCGKEGSWIETYRLVECFFWLQEEGCENLNLITPTHYLPHILQALSIARSHGFHLPIVYNTSGFERVEILSKLEGLVDIYLPDFKFWTPETALALCGTPDYPAVVRRALKEMHRQVGDLKTDEQGRGVRGILVRHLILPGYFNESRSILQWLAQELSIHTHITLMGHFRPCHRAREDSRLNRTLSEKEYETIYNWAIKQGLYRLDETHRKLYPLIWRKDEAHSE
jgi:putative pyruvate formate lyase activating enzyme